MTTFIIWANTIPDAHRYFLTPGKRYEASRWGEFFDDEGDEVQAVLLGPSNLLDGDEWQMSPLDRLRLWFVSRCGAVHVWWWRRPMTLPQERDAAVERAERVVGR